MNVLKRRKNVFLLALIFPLVWAGCKNDGGFNVFSIEDDISLGLQVSSEIESDSSFEILDPNDPANNTAYQYLYDMRDEILAAGNLKYQDEFEWEVKIIHDDSVQNAFATPGGYMYIYTGLIHYLESASALAGVLGHEMAHADRRHSTNQLTKRYGLSVLLEVVLGQNQGLLSDIAATLLVLKFSRNDEADADEHSVIYLCPTDYHADGAADFFQKIIDEGSSTPPQFLSTHPSPDNRVEDIHAKEAELACNNPGKTVSEYDAFKASLP